jgi:hypothetical protein
MTQIYTAVTLLRRQGPMRTLLLLVLGLSACASHPGSGPPKLYGTLANQAHSTPLGETQAAPVIELAQFVAHDGARYSTVQLILGEKQHTQWASLVGRSAIVICSPLERGSLWAHPHLHCQPSSITVVP